MPAIHIQLSPLPTDVVLAQVAQGVLQTTQQVLGKDPQLTAVFIDALPASRWWIAGQNLHSLGVASYCLTIRITDETNTKVEKAQYIAQVHALMRSLLGPTHPCSYVHVHDVRASAYGWDGQTQEWRAHQR